MSQHLRTPLRALAVSLALCALLLLASAGTRPPAAHASPDQLSIMMDDDLLVYRDDATRDTALKRMKALGVDTVRVTVLWSSVAENALKTPARTRRFQRLGAANPKAYLASTWDRYDRLVRAAQTLGLQVYFDVTGPGPAFAHAKPPRKYAKDAHWWRPKPREFFKFTQAVGRRFSGTYRDENDGRRIIPRVSFWALWNEPNQGGWLRPQWLGGRPVSPQLYRDLFRAGRRALVATGHGKDTILAGETAPRSVKRRTTTSAMGVRTFVTELLCGPGHRSAGCGSFKTGGPILATAWAHHPYTRSLAPNVPEPDKDSITLANFDQLGTLLDTLSKTKHIRSGIPLMSTEFGYETTPPDPFSRVTQAQQADYLALAEAITAFDPRVAAHTQFLLRDVAPDRRFKVGSRPYWGTYQSGLFNLDDTPKPAAAVYAFPFLAGPGATRPDGQRTAAVFGQIRFRDDAPPGQPSDPVQLEFQPAGSADYSALGDPLPTSARGYFTATVPVPGPGRLRAVWKGAQAPFVATSAAKGVQGG